MSYLQFTTPPLPHFIVSGEDTYVPGQIHIERTKIGVFDLIFVTRGRLYMEENGENWDIASGQVLILRPDLHHSSAKPCSEETHFYWLHFQTVGTWSVAENGLAPLHHKRYESQRVTEQGNGIQEESGDYIDIKVFNFTVPKFTTLRDANRTYIHLEDLLRLEGSALPEARWRQQGLFHTILQEISIQHEQVRLSSNTVRLAEDAAGFIRKNYEDQISLAHLGETFKFHPAYISRCMREVYGCTPLEYLTRYRIDAAKTLLMNTNQPIEYIAEKVGFRQGTYFSRCFSKMEGMTPRDFRKQYRLPS